MTKPQVSREALKAMAGLSGLELDDERLEELLPQVQRIVEAMDGLDLLNLESIEPAVVFKADME